MCSVFSQTGEGVAVTLMTNGCYKTVKVKIIYLPDLCTMFINSLQKFQELCFFICCVLLSLCEAPFCMNEHIKI